MHLSQPTIVEGEIAYVEDLVRKELQVGKIRARKAWRVLELDIYLIIDAIYVCCHRLMDLIEDAVGRGDEDGIALCTDFDPDHEYLVQTALSIASGLALIGCSLAHP